MVFNLQTALDARLASLKKKKVENKQTVSVNNISKEYIKSSLIQAGILNDKGEVINRTAS